MTEEKKDALTEQQTFLSEHEELLKSINKRQNTPPDEQAEPVEKVPLPEIDTEEPSIANEPPVPESPGPVEEPVAVEEPASTTEPEATTEPTPEPVVEAPVEKPQPKPQDPDEQNEKKMVPQKHQHSSKHEDVLKQQALEQKEVKEVLVFFQKCAKPATIVIAIACVFVLTDKFIKAQRHKKEAAADTALMNARGAEDFQAIVNNYASTPSGPLALMELAREKFNSAQFDQAEELYTRFTKKHADHELAAQAELNLITCKEAKDQLGEAHLLYGQFAKKHEGAYLVPSAMIGQARCLEALDQLDEAQIAYEDVIVNYPETGWSRIAEANLKVVLSKKK